MHALDLSIFYYLHSFAGQSGVLDAGIVFVANYLIYGVLLGLACLAVYAWLGGKKQKTYGYVVAVVSGLIARYVVATGIRHFYARPRPFIELGVSHIVTDTAASFPSGHTIFMFALATAIFQINKKFGSFLYIVGLLIGIARIAGGVHYPSDILGGIVLGVIVGFVTQYLYRYIYRKYVTSS